MESISSIFEYLTNVSVNFWFYLAIVSAPIMIFAAKPKKSLRVRLARLLLAILCTYVLINLSLHTGRTLDWKAYEQCQSESQYRVDSPERYEACNHHINIADGASNIFYLYLGWIPAAAYVGFWQLLRRWFCRKRS